jgi:peptidyl-prolyl cis-trans isomerase SurA
MRRTGWGLLTMAAAALALAGCAEHRATVAAKPTPPAPPSELPPTARMQKPDGDKPDPDEPDMTVSVSDVFPVDGRESVRVLVNVNGQPILAEEVREACMADPGWMEALRLRDSEQQKKVCNHALQDLIDREVVMADIHARLGKNKPQFLDKLREAAHKEFEKHLKTIEKNAKRHGMKVESREDLKKVFQSQGLSFDGYRRHFERNFMKMEYLRARIGQLIFAAVDRQAIFDYYEQHGNEFEITDAVQWQHIFLDAGRFPSRAAAGAFARQLVGRARAGEDFAALATKHDQGDSSYRNGAGVGKHHGEISPAELELTLFQLKEGEVGAPLEAASGFHVVRVVKREYAGRKPLDDELQSAIRHKLLNEMSVRETRRVIAELRRKATIERAGPQASPPKGAKKKINPAFL